MTTTPHSKTEYICDYFRELLAKNEKSKLYCILDCAQDKLIYKMLTLSNVTKYCLYKKQVHFPGERLTSELAAVAPYLVECKPDDQFLSNALYHGWGKNWCTFVFSDRTPEIVYEHCSGNLLAITEEGDTVQFRYFDPRILRLYLPSCTSTELKIFFGPVAAYCCEDEIGSEPILFSVNSYNLRAIFPDGSFWTAPGDLHDDIKKTGQPESSRTSSAEEDSVTRAHYSTIEFQSPEKVEVPFKLDPKGILSFGPDKYTITELPSIDCDERKHICKQRCCRLIFALTEQDVQEGIVRWDSHKPYMLKRNERHICVHLVDGQCSIYEHRPGVCRKLDCRNDRRFWTDFEGMVPAD